MYQNQNFFIGIIHLSGREKNTLIKLENSWNSTPFRNLEHFIILWYLRIVNVYVFWCVLNIGQGYYATVVC